MNLKKLSVVIPCLNEAQTIGTCINKIRTAFTQGDLNGEIIIVDNGCTDTTAEIARSLGAVVVEQPIKGYGAAYHKGFETARYEWIVMADGDDTYDFLQLPLLVEKLDKGYDMVLGSRFMGSIGKGAMSFAHRYIGNPILTAMLNIFFRAHLSDAHTGFRAITRAALDKLRCKTTGMEFASEMIVAALREKLSVCEIPVTYAPRLGDSKLSSFSDAWRHIRFMLLFSPFWLFFVPGALLFFGGLGALVPSFFSRLHLFNHVFDVHSMVFFAAFMLLGFQLIWLGLFAKAYSYKEGFDHDDFFNRTITGQFNLEKSIGAGFLLFLLGSIGSIYIVIVWLKAGHAGYFDEIKLSLMCLVLMVIGIQTVFSSFFLSLIRLPKVPQ